MMNDEPAAATPATLITLHHPPRLPPPASRLGQLVIRKLFSLIHSSLIHSIHSLTHLLTLSLITGVLYLTSSHPLTYSLTRLQPCSLGLAPHGAALLEPSRAGAWPPPPRRRRPHCRTHPLTLSSCGLTSWSSTRGDPAPSALAGWARWCSCAPTRAADPTTRASSGSKPWRG
jgi:hypothetical protein